MYILYGFEKKSYNYAGMLWQNLAKTWALCGFQGMNFIYTEAVFTLERFHPKTVHFDMFCAIVYTKMPKTIPENDNFESVTPSGNFENATTENRV
jgi:hypothetical protein